MNLSQYIIDQQEKYEHKFKIRVKNNIYFALSL